MSTFLFASIPIPAHTTNPLPFAARLVEQGHRVLWYSGAVFHQQIEAVGAEPVRYVDADDFGGRDLEEYWPQYRGLSPIQTIRRVFADVFVGHAPQRVSDLRRILAGTRVDAMLCDGLMVGVGMAGELAGVPWATFGDGPLPFEDSDTPPFGPGLLPMRGPVGRTRNALIRRTSRRFIFADAERVYREARAELGLPIAEAFFLDELASPYLHLQGCTAGFEYPRRSLPPHAHWVGALRPDRPRAWTPPSWWPEVLASSRPVVAVSQGTMRPDLTELVVPAVQALAGQDVLVVVTTGQATPDDLVAALGRTLPANARVARFIPYDLLLARASVFVTNGGYTGVTLALAHGVPLVQAGTTEEKVEIAARIKWSGVGVTLGSTRPSPEAIGKGVRTVLDKPTFRAAAGAIRQEMADHDAGREGAELLLRLAHTGRPVPRGETVMPGRAGRPPAQPSRIARR